MANPLTSTVQIGGAKVPVIGIIAAAGVGVWALASRNRGGADQLRSAPVDNEGDVRNRISDLESRLWLAENTGARGTTIVLDVRSPDLATAPPVAPTEPRTGPSRPTMVMAETRPPTAEERRSNPDVVAVVGGVPQTEYSLRTGNADPRAWGGAFGGVPIGGNAPGYIPGISDGLGGPAPTLPPPPVSTSPRTPSAPSVPDPRTAWQAGQITTREYMRAIGEQDRIIPTPRVPRPNPVPVPGPVTTPGPSGYQSGRWNPGNMYGNLTGISSPD